MSKLFVYTKEAILPIRHLLKPYESRTSLHDQQQVAALEAAGFQVLWYQLEAQQMHRFGMLQAKTHADGVLWAYARAKWEDGYARWALRVDIDFYRSLVTALTPGDTPDAVRRSVLKVAALENLFASIARRRVRWDSESLGALEAVVRLGTRAQVLHFLETM